MITNITNEVIGHTETKDEVRMCIAWNDKTTKDEVIDCITNIAGRYVNGHRVEVITSRIKKILDLADISDIKDLTLKSSWDDEDEAEEWTEVFLSRYYADISLETYFSIN